MSMGVRMAFKAEPAEIMQTNAGMQKIRQTVRATVQMQ